MYEYIIEDLYPWKNKFYVKDIWSNGFELREVSFFFQFAAIQLTINEEPFKDHNFLSSVLSGRSPA